MRKGRVGEDEFFPPPIYTFLQRKRFLPRTYRRVARSKPLQHSLKKYKHASFLTIIDFWLNLIFGDVYSDLVINPSFYINIRFNLFRNRFLDLQVNSFHSSWIVIFSPVSVLLIFQRISLILQKRLIVGVNFVVVLFKKVAPSLQFLAN